jgi:YD repeat-containing protein
MRIRCRCLLRGLIPVLLIPLGATAEVPVKNGDFQVAYDDISYRDGLAPGIVRVYNSKSGFSGIFGPGWGIEFDKHLDIDPDGSVVLHEYGGADSRFAPVGLRPADASATAGKILAAARDSHDIVSAAALEEYRAQLIGDAGFCRGEWQKYMRRGLVRPVPLAAGAVLSSGQLSRQSLIRLSSGYERHLQDGRRETFDDSGRLIQVADARGNFIQLNYDVRSRIQLLDNYGQRLTLFLNDRKLVERIEGDSGKVARYRYDSVGDIVFARDAEGGSYRYEYDRQHNLTAIRYGDGTSMEMSYFPEELYGNIRSVKARDGAVTAYAYWIDPADSGHYRVTVSTRDAHGEAPSTGRYEYFRRHTAGGAQYTGRAIIDVDGGRTDTTYNERGLPTDIVQGAARTHIEYDRLDHVICRETAEQVTWMQYDPRLSKVSYVQRASKADSKAFSCAWKGSSKYITWSRYGYGATGNLLEAGSSEGVAVRLSYDGAGRIGELLRQDGSSICVSYNPDARPAGISLVSPGSISTVTATYKPDGGIDKFESPEDRTAAEVVTVAVRQMQDLLGPAGVTLPQIGGPSR